MRNIKSNFLNFGPKYIGNKSGTFIIAELGVNHGGDFKKCIKMINAAYKAGADSVKIQTNDVNESYMSNTQSYREFKHKDFSINELLKLKKYSERLGVSFFSSPGDIKSLMKLIKIKVPAIKISSGMATNFPLIGECLKRKIPIIISTGFLIEKDLESLKKFIRKFNFKKIVLLKCTSMYPAASDTLNLNSISFLKKKFNLPIGYSDHSLGDVAPAIAVSCGAVVIEKHFTLNKKQKGADHKISLEPKEFKTMVEKIRITEKMLGKDYFVINSSVEKKRYSFLRYLTAKKSIKKGDKFSFENISFMRHKNGKNGLKPEHFFNLKNKSSKRDIEKGKILTKKIL